MGEEEEEEEPCQRQRQPRHNRKRFGDASVLFRFRGTCNTDGGMADCSRMNWLVRKRDATFRSVIAVVAWFCIR